MEEDLWQELRAKWDGIGGTADQFVVIERRQLGRAGFAVLLLRRGRPLLFVKLDVTDSARLRAEFDAQMLIVRSHPTSFRVPLPLILDSLEGWEFLASEALPAQVSRPPKRPQLRLISDEIQAGLAPIPRPVGVPRHWKPMHGDLTPSNLRQYSSGFIALVDWEEAGWGPPGADRAHYIGWSAALKGRIPTYPRGMEEAREFWLASIKNWGPDPDRSFAKTRVALEAAFSGPNGRAG